VKGPARKIAAAGLVILGIAVLAAIMYQSDYAGNKDFTSYWAAGQLLARHSNPYDVNAVLRLEKSAGFHEEKPLIMRNPPYALPLALPLGLVGPRTGAVLWSLLLVAAIVASVRLLWSMLGKPPDVHLFAYMFAPCISGMIHGQTSALIILGLALFLFFQKERPAAAGAVLVLAFIKPHLLLPFAVVLVLWIAGSRAYKVAMGAAVSMAAALAISLFFDHNLWSDYLPVLRDAGADSHLIPTASAILRSLGGHDWLQFAPAVLGSVWAIWYFLSRRERWDWIEHGPVLLLVSLFVAPYSWFPDEMIALPAIMLALKCAPSNGALGSFLVLNFVALAMLLSGLSALSPLILSWTPSAWLIWYLWSNRQVRSATTARWQAWELKRLKTPAAPSR